MAPRFNPNRPHGTIHPPTDGAWYEQDGMLFNKDGKLVSDPSRAAKSAPAEAADEADKDVSNPPVAEIDLAAWAKKEVNYPFFSVAKAAADQFPGSNPSNSQEVLELLVQNGVVTAEEVAR